MEVARIPLETPSSAKGMASMNDLTEAYYKMLSKGVRDWEDIDAIMNAMPREFGPEACEAFLCGLPDVSDEAQETAMHDYARIDRIAEALDEVAQSNPALSMRLLQMHLMLLQRGISRDDLADAVGVSRRHVYRVLFGKVGDAAANSMLDRMDAAIDTLGGQQ